ncbi:hypothetical protein GWN63_02600 [Candidatus Bathyarchaeota archaeon]|nr:serine/threonine protein phosphatase [Candidatus Bathyarchaeota archaeon]NIR14522.1 serine/threonine protein phosphatase [Desulfobacterales bacterium]NIU81120.1 hypothetical protein [Candidatus Bathyarchaeota archaeon]NIV67749.1 hypothetical protein [Candidatus Bathyarchaeota archaeon]
MVSNQLHRLTPNLLSQTRRILVAGDLHGDHQSLQRIKALFQAEQDLLLFLGDYADRGPKGVEVIQGVNKLITEHPSRIIALKGNHEDYGPEGRPRFMPCTLRLEAQEKTGGWETYFHNQLAPFLEKLRLAALIPGEVLFLHGGISIRLTSLQDLESPSREVEEDLLWSDPSSGRGERPNRRGVGVEFGEDITKEVCHRLNVKRIVRGHEPRKARNRPHLQHQGRIVTINSTRVYGGTPFILDLPPDDLTRAFQHLGEHTQSLN